MKNRLRQALLDRTATFGGWIQFTDPASAEIFAALGYDWICVDLEHGTIDVEAMTHIFRAAASSGCVPLARLPWCDPVWIKRTLDAGASGIVVPMVNSREEAKLAVREAKYPPTGSRGYGFCRANSFGIAFPEAAMAANDETAVIVQVEHRDAIANLDSILSVPGVDAAFIGPYDLSGSYGKPGEFSSVEMRAALAEFHAACKRHGKSAGAYMPRADAASVADALREGFSMLALGADTVFLANTARQVIETARAVAKVQTFSGNT